MTAVEIVGITKDAKSALVLTGYSVNFLVDSQARSAYTKPHYVRLRKEAIIRFSVKNSVNILWVLRFTGNEAGSAIALSCRGSFSVFRACFVKWNLEEHLRSWNTSTIW